MAVDWNDFVVFMKRSFATMLPAHDARRCYERLRQTGSVKDYVRGLVQTVRELESTPYHPGGSVFYDFIKGLRFDVRRFAEDHAPTGWWTNIQDLYQKALDFEINGLASSRARDRSPDRGAYNVGRFTDSRERCYAGKKRKAAPGETAEQPGLSNKGGDAGPSEDKKLWIPKGEVAACKAAKVCMWFGLEGHVGKDCKNPRSLTPSFAKGG